VENKNKIQLGRIVWVKSPLFLHECPGIIVGVFDEALGIINITVFTPGGGLDYVPGSHPQDPREGCFGWRWPPREDEDAAMRLLEPADAPAVEA
jgi:hypothetical protein